MEFVYVYLKENLWYPEKNQVLVFKSKTAALCKFKEDVEKFLTTEYGDPLGFVKLLQMSEKEKEESDEWFSEVYFEYDPDGKSGVFASYESETDNGVHIFEVKQVSVIQSE